MNLLVKTKRTQRILVSSLSDRSLNGSRHSALFHFFTKITYKGYGFLSNYSSLIMSQDPH